MSDTPPSVSSTRERAIFRVTAWCALGNAALSAVKLVVGIFGNSAAMVADAVHSLSDFVTDLALVFFMRVASRPPDEDHKFGHGKFETLATVVIGTALLGVAVGLFWSGGKSLWEIFHNGARPPRPSWIALAAAIATIIIKEAMYRRTFRVGKKYGSEATVANAWSHRADGLSSIATMIGIGVAVVFGDKWVFMDPLAAVFVSAFIVHAAIRIIGPALGDLVEKSLPKDVQSEILEIVTANPLVKSPHNLRTRRVGAGWVAQVHIRVDDSMSVHDSHELTQEIEGRIRHRFGEWANIIVHVEPASRAFADAKKNGGANKNGGTAAFTLVEVLIALALAAMLIPPALALFSSALGATTRAETRLETRLAAASALQPTASQVRSGEEQDDLRIFHGKHTVVVRLSGDADARSASVGVELRDGSREVSEAALFGTAKEL